MLAVPAICKQSTHCLYNSMISLLTLKSGVIMNILMKMREIIYGVRYDFFYMDYYNNCMSANRLIAI